MRFTRPLLVLLFVALFLATPRSSAAQGGEEAPTVNDVARELYCPQCTGQTVDVCAIQVCADMRELIAERLAAGDSPEEIKALFVARYGQRVLGKPATSGFDLSAWLMPFALLGVAALSAVLWLRNRPRGAPLVERAASTAPDDPYAAQLERELQRLEE